jgi:DNA invertase Pin-like site-specific DNA recombinase
VREGDPLVVHSLDRLARNLEDLLGLVRTLTDRGVTVTFVSERLTFTGGEVDKAGAMATMMLQMLGAVAQFERSLTNQGASARRHRHCQEQGRLSWKKAIPDS